MQPDGARTDTEAVEGIDARRLGERGRDRHNQAFMPAPAHAETEEFERVGEARDIDSLVDLEGEKAGEARQRGTAGMVRIDRTP